MSLNIHKICKVSSSGAFKLVAIEDEKGRLSGYAIVDENNEVVRWSRGEPDGEIDLEVMDPWPETNPQQEFNTPKLDRRDH